jgi:diguanylate cyclase (GGDEF)-like protein
MAQVLIVDEPSAARDALVELLTAAGHRVTVAADGADGLERWRAEKHELAVIDARAQRVSGAELAGRMKAETLHVFAPVILIVASAEPSARIEALLRTRALVDNLRAARAESESRSIADGVTGLRNRIFLGERLNEEFKRAMRYNEPLSLCLLSVEGLREVIAARGEPFGDRVLVAIANAALHSLRQIDVVCRYSAHELAALLPNTHFAGSLICAERLVRESARVPVDDFTPAVSLGIAFYPGKDVSEPADLLRIASRALDRAREEGAGRICLVQHQGYLYQPK